MRRTASIALVSASSLTSAGTAASSTIGAWTSGANTKAPSRSSDSCALGEAISLLHGEGTGACARFSIRNMIYISTRHYIET